MSSSPPFSTHSMPSILKGKHEPVAIVGMGCRWAGGVRDAPGLWELLRNKREGFREFEPPHFSNEGFHHSNPDRPGSLRTRGGFQLAEDARLFDHAFFGITGREVETMDPSQRKLLEVGKYSCGKRETLSTYQRYNLPPIHTSTP